MRARINPEQALSLAAVAIGLVVGVGVIGSGASVVPGCAAAECQSPRNVKKPASVLECPSGTLCYQGACVPSCASGSERVEKCESDDDCTSGVRPNCVERRCSSCAVGERCIPALDICSPIRPNESDAGAPSPDAGAVPAVTPLDGGRIDGSSLTFDSGQDPTPIERELTHILAIDVFQRIDLVNAGTATAAVRVDAIDVRGTGRIATATVGPIVFADGDECAVRRNERYTLAPPVLADLGVIQLQRDQGPLMRDQGLVSNFVATFTNGRYLVTPPLASTNVLQFSTSANVRGTEISGAGIMPITAGRWPQATNAPEIFTPDMFDLSGAARVALRNIDVTGEAAFFELDWTKGIPLAGSRVLVTVSNAACTLRCSFDEEGAQLRVTTPTILQFRRNPCNAVGPHTIFVDRSSGAVLDVNSAFNAGFAVRATAEVRHGFVGRIVF